MFPCARLSRRCSFPYLFVFEAILVQDPRPFSLQSGTLVSAEDFDFSRFDALLSNTSDIDTFCSSSSWAESSRRAFMPAARLAVYEHRDAMAVFAVAQMPEGHRMLLPLDATWTLGSPIAASNPRRDIAGLVSQILDDRDAIDFCIISGIRSSSTFYRIVVTALTEHMVPVTHMRPAQRAVADISDGFDAWFSRRSSKFRASVRRARRTCAAADIRFESLPAAMMSPALMRTFHEIEARSWKGKARTGITEKGMADFCHNFLDLTATQQQTRVVLAYDNELPIGFVLGAVSQNGYRGAQMSFDNSYRSLGLGNMLQISMIESLIDGGVAAYDLGSSMPYKLRWADFEDRTNSLLIGPLHRL